MSFVVLFCWPYGCLYGGGGKCWEVVLLWVSIRIKGGNEGGVIEVA